MPAAIAALAAAASDASQCFIGCKLTFSNNVDDCFHKSARGVYAGHGVMRRVRSWRPVTKYPAGCDSLEYRSCQANGFLIQHVMLPIDL